MIRKMKTATLLILILMLPATFVFAGSISSVKLDNVVFSGKINDVGTASVPSPVEISNSPSGSSYEIVNAHISTLKVSGSGSIVISGGDVAGKIEVSGSPSVTFSGCTLKADASMELKSGSSSVRFENCTISMTDGTAAAIKSTQSGYSGTLTIGVSGKECTISSPASFTVDLSSSAVTSVSIATNNTVALKAIKLNGCTSLSSFDMNQAPVSTLDMTGCSNSSLRSYIGSGSNPRWNAWHVTGTTTKSGDEYTKSGLILSGTGLSGPVSFNNPYITSLDVSGNSITSLTVIGGGTNYTTLKHVFGGNNKTMTTASIKMNASEANGILDLHGNSLGSNTTLRWCVSGRDEVEETSYPSDQTPPASPSAGSTYYTYDNISGPYTRYVNCTTCGGDGRVNEQTHDGDEIVLQFSSQEERDEYVASHPGASSGGHVTSSSGEYWNAYTGEYGPSETTSDPCPTCMTDDYTPKYERAGEVPESYYTAIRTKYTYSADFGLQINGNSIHTSYDAGTVQSTLYMDFTSEWEGLESMNVNLRDNGICYRGGFPASTSYDKWRIRFRIATKGLKTTDYVAIFDCDENGAADNYAWGNGYYTLYSNLNFSASAMSDYSDGYRMFSAASGDGTKVDYRGIPKHEYPNTSEGATRSGQRYQPFTVQNIRSKWSSFPTNGSCYVMLYRDVNAWGSHMEDNDEAARGPDFAVYPFGESSLNPETSWPGRNMNI